MAFAESNGLATALRGRAHRSPQRPLYRSPISARPGWPHSRPSVVRRNDDLCGVSPCLATLMTAAAAMPVAAPADRHHTAKLPAAELGARRLSGQFRHAGPVALGPLHRSGWRLRCGQSGSVSASACGQTLVRERSMSHAGRVPTKASSGSPTRATAVALGGFASRAKRILRAVIGETSAALSACAAVSQLTPAARARSTTAQHRSCRCRFSPGSLMSLGPLAHAAMP
jgi:hypothetical protein